MPGHETEISPKSGSESNRAPKPANRRGSLSTTAIRISGFLGCAAFMAFCFPLRDIAISIAAFAQRQRITAVTLRCKNTAGSPAYHKIVIEGTAADAELSRGP